MKKSVFILASMALSAALYAQTANPSFSREEVLEIFAQFNPSVLEKAQNSAEYNSVLETFLQTYQSGKAPADKYELIGVARNFDNSIALQGLSNTYRGLWMGAKMTGTDVSAARTAFTQDVSEVMKNIWSVSVNLRQYQLSQTKAQLKAVRKDKTLSKDERAAQAEKLEFDIKMLKHEIKSLKKNSGEFAQSAAQDYVSSTEGKFEQELAAAREAAAKQAQAARQTKNLQTKTKNKKPVAKWIGTLP